ncbi:pyridoxamine 5'-phosphate oxidase family protein [Streptomyces sp. NPDC051018]|uniref:pyridoxamine 5'-phosphate oxidase family protein n=1 Tax=Streptomyces sp. NPDC051018 TaxID=3365639 RepID=UPI0037ABD9EE
MTNETSLLPSARSPWSDFRKAEPEFAREAEARFGAYRHHVLATLRKDGSPRLTGLEITFQDGEVLLGMMPDSLKAKDLRRDPRFSLYGNPGPGDDMDGGDVRITGRATEVTDSALIARYTGQVRPPEPFHLFRADVDEVVRVRVEGDRLAIRSWHPGAPAITRRRR